MASPTPEQNFVVLCQRVLDGLSSMIKDARDLGLSDINPTQLDNAKKMLAAATPDNLVISFIEKREYWPKIEKRDMLFMEKEIAVVFSDAGILEASVVEEPIRIYLLLKKWKDDPSTRPEQKASKKATVINYDEPVVNDEDIATLWNRFNLMIKLACKWNSAKGNKYNLSEFEARHI